KGVSSYEIDPHKDRGEIKYAKLEFWYVGGYGTYAEEDSTTIDYEDIVIDTVDYEQSSNTVIIRWNARGIWAQEKPVYVVR
ncbi:unnamed protein product, partial [Strongylus vulgaris]